MPDVGTMWSPVSPGQEVVLSIDLGPYLDTAHADTLDGDTLASFCGVIVGDGIDTSAILNSAPMLNGTVASQRVRFAPAGTYKLGFICNTVGGDIIELWSRFASIAQPDTIADSSLYAAIAQTGEIAA